MRKSVKGMKKTKKTHEKAREAPKNLHSVRESEKTQQKVQTSTTPGQTEPTRPDPTNQKRHTCLTLV